MAENNWGDEIIYTTPRRKTENDKYYHRKIVIRGNDFSTTDATVANIENVREVEIKNNKLNNSEKLFNIKHCKIKICDA